MAKTKLRTSQVTAGSQMPNVHANGDMPVMSFAHLGKAMDMPNLLDVQIKAFEALLEKVQGALQEHQDGDEAADDATLVVLRVPAGEMVPEAAV